MGGKPDRYGTKYDLIDKIEEIKVKYSDLFDVVSEEDAKEVAEVIAPFTREYITTIEKLPLPEMVDFSAIERNSAALIRLETLIMRILEVQAMNRADDELLLAIAAVI